MIVPGDCERRGRDASMMVMPDNRVSDHYTLRISPAEGRPRLCMISFARRTLGTKRRTSRITFRDNEARRAWRSMARGSRRGGVGSKHGLRVHPSRRRGLFLGQAAKQTFSTALRLALNPNKRLRRGRQRHAASGRCLVAASPQANGRLGRRRTCSELRHQFHKEAQ